MGRFEVFIGILAVAALAMFAYAILLDAEQWESFRTEHRCKVVSQDHGETFTTIGTDGTMHFGSTSGKTGWLCDDGVIHYREGVSDGR